MKLLLTFLFLLVFIKSVTADPFEINKGITGTWYDSSTSGQGQLIDVLPDSQQIFLAWFTYSSSVDESESKQEWWTALGPYSGSTSQLLLYQTNDGLFNNSQTVETNAIGEIQLDFFDCYHGLLSYTFYSGLSGQIQITRLVPDTICEQINEN